MNKKSIEIMDQNTKDGKVDWKAIEKDYIIVMTDDDSSFNFINRSRITTMQAAQDDEKQDEHDRATVRKIIEEQGYGTF